MREIGSEFCTQYKPVQMGSANNEAYLMSGRTALRFIIDDICRTHEVRKALLPSYCCESMIIPFVQTGIDVQFYQVNYDCIDYAYDNDADVVFLIDFFGYTTPKNSEIARIEKQAGKIIVYDSTHKIDGNPCVQKYVDYTFCSYRKWFYCNYAQAIKHNGEFNNEKPLMMNSRYIEIRDKAARDKEKYLVGSASEKEVFLNNFYFAESMLDEDYVGYAGVPVAFDLYEITSKRRENATYLIKELKKIPEIKLWRNHINSDDTPMFVPILVDPLIRNDLRSALIKENVYCPIHWPKSSYHGDCNELYDAELSLVCDQRYSITDMERMISIIEAYFNR